MQYITKFELDTGILWGSFNPKGVPCYNLSLLKEVRAHDQLLTANAGRIDVTGELREVRYYVNASLSPRVFNLGGDLALFVMLIKSRDREALEYYARACIDILFMRCQNYATQALTTLALVQGDALGGGFECALASDVIIAEESAQFGLPELIFNLIPGMGAFSLLSRRLGMRQAQEFIFSTRMFSAAEMRDIGIVDVVAKDGEGEAAVREWIKRNAKNRNGVQAAYAARRCVNPLTREELDKIVAIWVHAAFSLQDRDLNMMSRIVRAQMRRLQRGNVADVVSAAIAEEQQAEVVA